MMKSLHALLSLMMLFAGMDVCADVNADNLTKAEKKCQDAIKAGKNKKSVRYGAWTLGLGRGAANCTESARTDQASGEHYKFQYGKALKAQNEDKQRAHYKDAMTHYKFCFIQAHSSNNYKGIDGKSSIQGEYCNNGEAKERYNQAELKVFEAPYAGVKEAKQ